MKKLTLVLVALLLALACVFAACGKKNNDTPADTDPKPVDPTPVVEPTVAKEDLLKIAEALKAAYVENYVGLYSDSVANAIEAEKSAALLNITGASSKEEAQKIADDFIAFLKAQKTTVDELKDLIEKIGDVALADEDAIYEAKAYVDALTKAYAGANAAKKAVLDAFKADETTVDTVNKMKARVDELKAIKKAADKDTGVNGKEIANLKKTFTGEKYTFTMASYDLYEATVAAVEAAAKSATTGAIKADSDAYAEIFDVATLAEMKALLDAAIAAKPAMTDLKAIIDAAEALKVTAEDARYKVFCYVNTKNTSKEFATAEEALAFVKDSKEEDVEYVEAAITKTGADAGLYKFTLKADIDAAQKLVDALTKNYTTSDLKAAGYVKDDASIADKAIKAIKAVADAYADSLIEAEARYDAYLGKLAEKFVTATPAKDDTVATYTGFETAAKNYTVATTAPGTKLGDEIAKIVGTFKTVNASGYKVSTKGYINDGDYALKDKDGNSYKFYLVNGAAAIKYTAWTYSYEFDGKALGAVEVFDVLAELGKDAKAAKAEAALKWLVIFIGEEDYAEKYDLAKDYGFGAGKVLYMTDRDVKEVATVKVAEINGADVKVAADEATEIKMLSSYTIAKAVVEAYKEITAAQEAAVEELKAAVLALRTTGDANAIAAVDNLYKAIEDGSYVNKKLNGEDADAKKNASYAFDPKDVTVVVKEATDTDPAVPATVKAMLDAAKKAYTEAFKLLDVKSITDAVAALDAAKDDFAENEAMVAAFAKIVAKATAEVARCQAAYALTTTDSARIVNEAALNAATAAADKVKALADLLLEKAAFDARNDGETILKAADKGAEIWDLFKGYTDFATTAYTALNAADADLYELCEYLAAIYGGTGKDQAALKVIVDDAEKALVKACADFEIDYTVGAKVDATAFFTKLDTFAKDYNADYLNLTVAYTYGDNTITVDLFTEAYRQAALAKVYGVIANIKTAANTLAGKDVLAGDNWETLVTAAVNATEIKLAAQTSRVDAAKLAAAYTITEATYKLDTVLNLINAELGAGHEITLAALKTAAKIAD